MFFCFLCPALQGHSTVDLGFRSSYLRLSDDRLSIMSAKADRKVGAGGGHSSEGFFYFHAESIIIY